MRVEDGFHQTPFPDEHPYTCDPVLPSLLKRMLPEDVKTKVDADFVRLGHRLINDTTARTLGDTFNPHPIRPMGSQSRFTPHVRWLAQTKDAATEEGYFSIAYGNSRREFGEYGRTYMFAKNMIMVGDFNVIMCPLGMTDGSARVIELFGTKEMKEQLVPRLISRDPTKSAISGQRMTERPGGLDLSLLETTASPAPTKLPSDLGEPYILNGFKWFSSAAECHMAVALARTGSPESGSRGLSLFLVPLKLGGKTGLDNGVKTHRLKNKIGTWGVPTAELELHETRAWLLGPLGGGIKSVGAMLNITRMHSAIHSVGSIQRALSIARSYASVRSVCGGKLLLQDVPMHVSTLAEVNLLYRALTHLTFGAVRLLGKSELHTATPSEEYRLRLLTPAVKAYTALRSTGAIEECMGALGGLGYMEEVGIGRLIRDQLVEKIWEGTISILSVDLVRASKDGRGVEAYMEWAEAILKSFPSSEKRLKHLQPALSSLHAALTKLPLIFKSTTNPLLPRPLLSLFASISAVLYLLEHAIWSWKTAQPEREVDMEVFRRWVEEGDLVGCMGEVERLVGLRGEWEGRGVFDGKLVYGASQAHCKL